MARPNVVLCGSIGAGKSWLADYLVKARGYAVVNFADKLKAVAADVFGLERRHVYGTQADKTEPILHVRDAAGLPQTGRGILEWLGTEGFRTLDPDVWVKFALRTMREQNAVGIPVVIGDGRFPNEFVAIRALGGEVWKVVKVSPDPEQRTGHPSDELWRAIPADFVLVANAGDTASLARQADRRLGFVL